jgi:hypothetical protein
MQIAATVGRVPQDAPSQLREVTLPPRFLLRASDPKTVASEARAWRASELNVWFLRGPKMRTVDALFDEVGAALQFPYYFGENWPALDDCITDLEWVPPRAGYVLVLAEAEMVLDDERDALNVLRRVLTNAVTEWAKPVELGEWWDRPPVPFSVVLQTNPQDLERCRARWIEAGAVIEPVLE